MKTLSGKKLLQDLGLKAGELVQVGDTIYRYEPEVYGRGTKWDRMTKANRPIGVIGCRPRP